MKLRKDMRVKDVQQDVVGTVTVINDQQDLARVEFDNGKLGVYDITNDRRLVPAVGYYEWLRLLQLNAATVESQLGSLRFARGRWLNGLVKGDGAAHEMSCAIGELLRTLHMLNEGDSR